MGNLLRLARLSQDAQDAAKQYYEREPGLKSRVFLFIRTWKVVIWTRKEMMRVLTFARFPILHIHKLSKVIDHLDLNDTPNKSHDPEGSIDNIAIHLAAELGTTPQAVIDGTTVKQAEGIYIQIEMRKLEEQLNAIVANHPPERYVKDLQTQYKKLEREKKKRAIQKHSGKKVVSLDEVRQDSEPVIDTMSAKSILSVFK